LKSMIRDVGSSSSKGTHPAESVAHSVASEWNGKWTRISCRFQPSGASSDLTSHSAAAAGQRLNATKG
jgi:hypothetical protein